MGNIKTVSVSAETAVKFDSFYPYAWIKNTGDAIAYASAFAGIVAGAENVTAIPAGESVMITAETDTVYILSTGTTAEVHGQGYAESPFLDNYSEGSGTSITVESLSVTENGTYTAQTGKAYSPVSVDVSAPEYVDRSRGLVLYDNSGVNANGFKNTDVLESDYVELPADTAATVELCGVISINDTNGRIWQIGSYSSVGNTFAYDNSGSTPMFELAIHNSWDSHQFGATDYLDTLVTISIVIGDSGTKVYINGTLVDDQITLTKSDIDTDDAVIRFLHGTTASRAASGNIYAFRVYHRALTAAEIQHNADVDAYYFGE